MPYHVRITTRTARGRDEVKLDLTDEQLRERFVNPYHEGKAIVTGGRTILISDIERIRITYTEESSEQLLPIVRREKRNKLLVLPSNEWLVAARGKDVTDDFITAPPGI